MFRCNLPLYPITMGRLLDRYVLNINTASFTDGSVVVVVKDVVVVIVGLTSSHS